MQRRDIKIESMLSEINVTPFVDVMLVLLIIFMITAPMLKMGVDVDLPKTDAKEIPSREERLVLTLKKDKTIYLDRYKVKRKELKPRLRQILKRKMNQELFLRADRALPYGYVVEVLADIKGAGVTRLGMVTEPLKKGSP
jgi:biopolymer transport protein TolR